jgi:outer membrane protein
MKIILKNAAVAAAAIALCLIWSPAGTALGADQKTATVDLQKVFKEYYKTDRSSRALKQEAADMEKQHKDLLEAEKKGEEDWQKLIDKAEDQAISPEERARSKKAAEDKLREVKSAGQNIQAYDRASEDRLREKQRSRTDDIIKEIRGVLNAQAKAGGYTLVLDVSGESANVAMTPVVLYTTGVNDLTDGLIKELNAGAPATTADEKDVKDSKDTKAAK